MDTGYLSLWASFLIILILLFNFVKTTGVEDPIIRAFIWPVAAICYMSFGNNKFLYDADFYTYYFLMWVPFILAFYSTPKIIPQKSINLTLIYTVKIVALFGIFWNILDIYYNFNFDISVFNPNVNTFDLRGYLGNSPIKLISMGINMACLPLLALADNFKLKQIKFTIWIWILFGFVASYSSPGKNFLIIPFFYFLDYLFYKKIFGGPKLIIKKLFNFKNLLIQRRELKKDIFIFSSVVIILILTLFFIDIFTNRTNNNLFTFFSGRVFDASFPLTFTVIRDPNISADINFQRSEFSNIIEVWFKFIFKNLFNKEFINDTIPKYIMSLKGYTITGKSSMTQNMFVETTVVHGRYMGSFIGILTCIFGAFLRKRFLSLNTINISTLFFIPIIETGPFFCLIDGQFFWTIFTLYFAVIMFSFFGALSYKSFFSSRNFV